MNQNQLPILYARGEKNKVLEWEIIVDGNMFYTVTGAQGYKKVTSEPTICSGKNIGRSNETTPEEQAYLEAKSRWDKRKKSGGYYEDIADIDRESSFVEPMLANKLTDRRDKIDPATGLIAQKKFNGLRCIATRRGLHTRKGERYISVPHIEESLITFFEKYPNAFLDGELYSYDYREQLNQIVKLCRKTVNISPFDIEASEKMVRYYVYDGYGFGSVQDSSYQHRKDNIDKKLLLHCKYFEPVKDFWFYSWEELDEIYQSFIDDREEGAMVRLPLSPYQHGKRSNFLLKVKPTDDAEFEIISVEEGNGNWSGVAKIIGLRMPNGKEFNGTFKGTKDEALEMLLNKERWIGRVVTVNYNGFTGLGVPNYAQVDYKNMVKG